MDDAPVLIRNEGSVSIIQINRPGKRNAVDRPTATALRQAFEAFEQDDSLKVAILAGTGGNFCAGADRRAAIHYHMGMQLDPLTKGNLGANRAERPDKCTVPDLCLRINHSAGVNLRHLC